jgi:hypothetical protein
MGVEAKHSPEARPLARDAQYVKRRSLAEVGRAAGAVREVQAGR